MLPCFVLLFSHTLDTAVAVFPGDILSSFAAWEQGHVMKSLLSTVRKDRTSVGYHVTTVTSLVLFLFCFLVLRLESASVCHN